MAEAQDTVPFIDAATVARLLDYPSLVDALREAFLDPPVTPDRQAIAIPEVVDQPAGTLLVMPAVRPAGLIGVKLVTIHPSLGGREGGALRAAYVVLDAASGDLRGMIDGHALTVRRTAAASVLAAKVLARPDPDTLLIVGTGEVCRALAEAYAAVIAPRRIRIWGRRPDQAARLAGALSASGVAAEPVVDLAGAVASADIVSAATLSQEPLILSRDVQPGTHIDLVGGFTLAMREADDDLAARAHVVADVEKSIREAGDIAGPIAAGRLAADDVALLADVLLGARPGRRSRDEVTLFKSAGHALEDLAAAELLFARLPANGTSNGNV